MLRRVIGADLGTTLASGCLVMGGDTTMVDGCVVSGGVAIGIVGDKRVVSFDIHSNILFFHLPHKKT